MRKLLLVSIAMAAIGAPAAAQTIVIADMSEVQGMGRIADTRRATILARAQKVVRQIRADGGQAELRVRYEGVAYREPRTGLTIVKH